MAEHHHTRAAAGLFDVSHMGQLRLVGPDAGRFDNTDLITEILGLRQELAGLLGFANYAELSLATKMADSPDQVIEFLKLHYVLNARDDSPYWQDSRAATSIPEALSEKLSLWRYRSPWHQDAEAVDDLFPIASYQYILYGMGFKTAPRPTHSHQQDRQQRQASILFQQNAKRAAQLRQASPSNRELLTKVKEFGFQKL